MSCSPRRARAWAQPLNTSATEKFGPGWTSSHRTLLLKFLEEALDLVLVPAAPCRVVAGRAEGVLVDVLEGVAVVAAADRRAGGVLGDEVERGLLGGLAAPGEEDPRHPVTAVTPGIPPHGRRDASRRGGGAGLAALTAHPRGHGAGAAGPD